MRLTVNYPMSRGRLVLRTARDWNADVQPNAVSDVQATFELEVNGAETLELKPVLWVEGVARWSDGTNYVVSAYDADRNLWPCFSGNDKGHVSDVLHVEFEGVTRSVRTYCPPGYDDNPLRRFPVLYMQDGQNLFFPEEAFAGNEWQVDETMDRLGQMNAIRKAIVVGVRAADRHVDYTRPGYDAYARFVVDKIKPLVDRTLRTRPGPEDTVVVGSSLGGVAALHLAWKYPHVFGRVACLSSTFGYADDLFERIAHEPKRDLLIYMDSGWPKDNYASTNAMRDLLVSRGFRLGHDLLHFSFPAGLHHERSWSERIHVPFQYFFGRAWLTQRGQPW